MPAASPKRYHRLEGCTIGLASDWVVAIFYAGEWHQVPRKVISAPINRGGNEKDEVAIEEWYARNKGWL